MVERAGQRLCGLIFGLVDYSADLGLSTLSYYHPVAEWARAEIVNAAGAAGVPAIDAMTVDYPVADPALDADANRTRFLDRMELAYRDAVHAREAGMAGKWVGHPAQLFASLGKRTVGHGDFAIAHSHGRCGMYGLKRLRGNMLSALSERFPARFAFAVGNGIQLFLVEVYQAQILHGSLLFAVEYCRCSCSKITHDA